MATAGPDPASMAALAGASYGAGVMIIGFRAAAVQWLSTHARKEFAGVLIFALFFTGVLAMLGYYALQGNRIDITIFVAAILGAVTPPALRLIVPPRRTRRTGSRGMQTLPTQAGYMRTAFGGVLLMTAVLGMTLLLLVNLQVNALVAVAAVLVIGAIPVILLTVVGALDLRHRGALSEARTVDLVKFGLAVLTRMIPTDLFRQLRG